MADLVDIVAEQLSKTIKKDGVDWKKLESILSSVDDINILSEDKDDSILSRVLADVDFSKNDEKFNPNSDLNMVNHSGKYFQFEKMKKDDERYE